jgi:predicted transcriptional regulator
MKNNDVFYALMRRHNLSVEAAAALIGARPTTVRNYLRPAGNSASQPVPDRVLRFLELALKADSNLSLDLDAEVLILAEEAAKTERNMSVKRWINRTLKREAKAAIKKARERKQENLNANPKTD